MNKHPRLWPILSVAVISLLAVFTWVDLSPRVQGDFFFSPDDPQYVASAEIATRFPSIQQIIIRASSSDIHTEQYRARLGTLAAALAAIDDVVGVNSAANRDATNSPLWRRVLTTSSDDATNLVAEVSIGDDEGRILVRRIENLVAGSQSADFELQVSGVPYVIELVRRNLFRDLAVFSTIAVVVFGAITAIIYRAWPIVVGTLASCLTAASVTLVVSQMVGGSIGLLTANIATIVFVLTLSHIIFLTSNWKLCCHREHQAGDPVHEAVALTLPASFWCMLTTFLGFSSLFLASAKPLHELGRAGAIGTAVAMLAAYVLFPVFLRHAGSHPAQEPASTLTILDLSAQRALVSVSVFAVIVAVAGAGLPRLSTDPSLLSYFADGTPLREGLEAIDRDGGSSPLNIVVQMPEGERIDAEDAVHRMTELQAALEQDSAVGMVMSPALLLAEARRAPLVGGLPARNLLDLLERTGLGNAIAGFVGPNRDQGLFFLRMRESERTESRQAVIDRIDGHIRSQNLVPVLVGGLYHLQAELGSLIASSLRLGLGGLVVLFLFIAMFVSRDARVTGAMVFCLAGIPLIVLGAFGHFGTPIDIISSPAANVSLAMGVDSMIHLMMRARRHRNASEVPWDAWQSAQRELRQPILGAALIITAGFGIFGLSTFPPTQKFGLAVILGTVAAATTALFVLPYGAAAVSRE